MNVINNIYFQMMFKICSISNFNPQLRFYLGIYKLLENCFFDFPVIWIFIHKSKTDEMLQQNGFGAESFYFGTINWLILFCGR